MPRVRIAGKLQELPGYGPLTPEDTEAVTARVLTSEHKRGQFDEHGLRGPLLLQRPRPLPRGRVLAARLGLVRVPRGAAWRPTTEELGLPEVVLVLGRRRARPDRDHRPDGLRQEHHRRGAHRPDQRAAARCHILTIEDPIEYLHRDAAAIVCQREIGLDAPTYHTALRAALRQDPDVILIGEVRDEETAMTALRAAETGHLVLCTLHTLNAAETVQRFIDLFGERQTALARQMLAGTLVGISSQRLVPGRRRRARAERRGARELVAGAGPDRERGRPRASWRRRSREGDYYGMRSFDQCLLEKVRQGEIARTDAIAFASDPHDFKLMMAADEELAAAEAEAGRASARRGLAAWIPPRTCNASARAARRPYSPPVREDDEARERGGAARRRLDARSSSGFSSDGGCTAARDRGGRASAAPRELIGSGSGGAARSRRRTEPRTLPGGGRRVFPDRRVVAYYGAPQDPELGTLGVGSPADGRRAAQAPGAPL